MAISKWIVRVPKALLEPTVKSSGAEMTSELRERIEELSDTVDELEEAFEEQDRLFIRCLTLCFVLHFVEAIMILGLFHR